MLKRVGLSLTAMLGDESSELAGMGIRKHVTAACDLLMVFMTHQDT